MKPVRLGRSGVVDPRRQKSSKQSSSKPLHTKAFELRIEHIAPGGRGVSHLPDGRVVFVDGTAPGDRVEVEVSSDASMKSGVRLLRVLEPGPGRVEPVCPIVSQCGGCDWMHLASEMQVNLHVEIVRGLLEHVPRAREGGDAVTSKLPEIRVWQAPRSLGYRTRARFHVSIDRRGMTLGYVAPRSHEIVDVTTCAVLDPRLLPSMAILRRLFAESRGSGEIVVGLGRAGLPVFDIRFDGELSGTFFGRIAELVDPKAASLAGARVTLDGVKTPAVFGDAGALQLGADDLPIVLAPGGFAQSSDEGAAILAKLVRERAAPDDKRVVELFAGSGTLSILLARGATAYVGVEIDPEASRIARENLAARSIAGKLVVADADAFEIPSRTDVVVLDPPRAGARGATASIIKARVRHVVYVSCDPATLARDARAFIEAGYELASIDTVELFPQTSHIETVVVFRRPRPGKTEASAS